MYIEIDLSYIKTYSLINNKKKRKSGPIMMMSREKVL